MRDTLSALATAWLLEPDREMLERLAQIPGLADVAAEITPQRAALEYSSVVLQLVPPYASLFLDEAAMLNGPEAERVELVYRRFDFEILTQWRAGPADHLGVELHFLAHLLARGDDRLVEDFLREFLLSWAPVCLMTVERIASARFYPRLASVTLDFLLNVSGELTSGPK